MTFDAFTEALRAPGTLGENVQTLLAYEWLPVEGREFYVQFDTATVNGVSIESPVFYPIPQVARPAVAAIGGK
ncbi:MAG: hypothetical protein ABJA98_00260 [Acidobacteriota bacterium]